MVSDKIIIGIVIAVVVIVFTIHLYDFYTIWHMETYAQKCGGSSVLHTLYEKECECNGTLINDNSTISPLFAKTGGSGYYCYGECMANCKCYKGFRENRQEIDCSEYP